MKRFFLLAIVLVPLIAESQTRYKRRIDPIFEERMGYPRHGWILGAGVTWAYTTTDVENMALRPETDSIFFGDVTGSTFIGPMVEVGKFHFFEQNFFINQLDYTVGFKQVKYFQSLEANYFTGSASDGPLLGDTVAFRDKDAKWVDNNITVNLNFSHAFQLGPYSFIMPSVGVHGDLRLGGKREFELDEEVAGYVFPENNVSVSWHARLSYGFKLSSNLFVVPAFEVQMHELMGDSPRDGIKRRYFHSEYTPVILSCRVLLHYPVKRNNCRIPTDTGDLSKSKRSNKKVRMF